MLQESIETEESGPNFGYAYRVFDNEDILLEIDGSNNITARYTHGPGIDEPLVMEKGGAAFFYHADGLGSITEITDSTGALKQQYTYSSFGKIESQLDPTFIQPYTFTAREFDPETGLYFYRHRVLDPNTGRFLQGDPILRAGDPTVPYLLPSVLRDPAVLQGYSYVLNNPTGQDDPLGYNPIGFIIRWVIKRVVLWLGGKVFDRQRAEEELDDDKDGIPNFMDPDSKHCKVNCTPVQPPPPSPPSPPGGQCPIP